MSKSEKSIGAAAKPVAPDELTRTALRDVAMRVKGAIGGLRLKMVLRGILQIADDQQFTLGALTMNDTRHCLSALLPLSEHFEEAQHVAEHERMRKYGERPDVRTSLVADGLRLHGMAAILANPCSDDAQAFSKAADSVCPNPKDLHDLRAAIDAGMAAVPMLKAVQAETLGPPHADYPSDLQSWEERFAYQRGVADARRVGDDHPAGRALRDRLKELEGWQSEVIAASEEFGLDQWWFQLLDLGIVAAPVDSQITVTEDLKRAVAVVRNLHKHHLGHQFENRKLRRNLELMTAAKNTLATTAERQAAELLAVGAGGVQPLSVVGKDMVRDLAEQVERLCNGLEHYDGTELWSDADVEEIEGARRLVRLVTPPGENWSVKKRDPRDVASDPEGKLIVNSGEPLKAMKIIHAKFAGYKDGVAMMSITNEQMEEIAAAMKQSAVTKWQEPCRMDLRHLDERPAAPVPSFDDECVGADCTQPLKPPPCPECDGTGSADSGGTEAWGWPICIACNHGYPWPVIRGTGRVADNEKALTVYCERSPTDEELASLHDALVNGKVMLSAGAAEAFANDIAVITTLLRHAQWHPQDLQTEQGKALGALAVTFFNAANAVHEDTKRVDFIEQRTKDWNTWGISFVFHPGIGEGFRYMHRHHLGAYRNNLREVIDFERGIMPTLPEFKKD